MKNLNQTVANIIQEPKAAVAVGMTTWGTGLATIIDLIPDDIGKLASAVGVILTIVLFLIHIRKSRRDLRESDLRIAILEYKKDALKHGIKLRRQENGITSEEGSDGDC